MIADHVLPFCQRCTGVYLGIGLSLLYLFLTRAYRKGLPPLSILYVNIAGLVIMPVFGFHILDPGPAWRLWSGLVFGNAVAFLLLPAASVVCHEGKTCGRHTRASTILFWILFAFLNAIPFSFPIESPYCHTAVVILSLIGLLGVLVCVLALMAFLVKKTLLSVILKGLGNELEKKQTCRLS
jgi:uncharacterized membrane protein